MGQGSNCHVILEAADGFLQSLGHRLRFRLLYSQLELISTYHEEQQKRQAVGKVILDKAAVSVNGVGVNGDLSDSSTTNGIKVNGFTGDESAAKVYDPSAQNGVQGAGEKLELGTISAQKKRLQTVSKPRLLILSASDQDGIQRQARNLQAFLDRAGPIQNQDETLQDISFTLNTRRTVLEWKSYSVLTSLSGISDLEASLSVPVRKVSEGTARLGLIFTGQGAQWPRMGHELLSWPVFRASLERSQDILTNLGCTWSLFGMSTLSITE